MLTIAREMTDPGRESDINLGSPSIEGFSSSTIGASESSTICFEPRLGGGDKDVSSGSCSGGGSDRGGGKNGVTGVLSCKKLGSFWSGIIFCAIGVARGEAGVAEAGDADGKGVRGMYPLFDFDTSLAVWAGGEGALSIRSRCLMEEREMGRGGGVGDVGGTRTGVGGRGRSGGGKGEIASAWGIVGRGSERGESV